MLRARLVLTVEELEALQNRALARLIESCCLRSGASSVVSDWLASRARIKMPRCTHEMRTLTYQQQAELALAEVAPA